MQISSLRKTRGSFLTLLILLLPLFTFAQVTCPADFSVCRNAASFELTDATPSGGTYSGKGVLSGTFSPMTAGTGTHSITYSYTEGSETRTCSFNIEVKEEPRVVCNLGPPTEFCVKGDPRVPQGNCQPMDGAIITGYSGPGITDNIFYPASVGAGEYGFSMSVKGTNGCTVMSGGMIIVNDDTPPLVNCPADMIMESSAEEPMELTASYSSSVTAYAYYSGAGISGKMFDPGVAGNGTHNIIYSATTDNKPGNSQCFSSCSFTIQVGVLPVTLTDFAAMESEGGIYLSWLTTMEKGFDRFELERSLNPKKGFQKIHEERGLNRSNSYSYIDSSATKGVPVYYRLKMIDLDGSFAYSTIIWALVEGVENVSVFPNPASTQLTIESLTEMVEIKLMNAVGNQLFTESGSRKRSKQINLPELPAGIYLLHVKDIRGASTYSRIVLK